MRRCALALGLFALTACQAPVVKPKALDARVLNAPPANALVSASTGGERTVRPDLAWMAIDATKALAFAGYRANPNAPDQVRFCAVVACEPENDLLLLQPLPAGQTPLSILGSASRRRTLENRLRSSNNSGRLRVSLRKAVDERRLAPPVPIPGRIFGAAANFPSHGQHDLAADPDTIASFAQSRARVFQKFPPVAPPEPGLHAKAKAPFKGVIGPFDTIRFPARIQLPPENPGDPEDVTEPAIDYEVEIGAVIGRELRWEQVQKMSDAELMKAISGYLLVNDSKARNPQMYCKARARNLPLPDPKTPYMVGDEFIDRVLGRWDSNICQWWSYAASWGDYAALGPFFVAAPSDHSFPARSVIAARTYAAPELRGQEIPSGHKPGQYYLRQASTVTANQDHPDALIWPIPQLIRSLLAPDSALEIGGRNARLKPGDIIATGTPGGVVITSKSPGALKAMSTALFWWDSDKWHEAFFGKDTELYLHPGDQLLLWGEGMGYQNPDIQRSGSPQ